MIGWLRDKLDDLQISLLRWLRGHTDPHECKHEWYVYCSITSTVSLQVICLKCETWGVVNEPTADEWERAYDQQWDWEYPERVEFTLPEKESD
ncbi:MAG: hypothetical protein AAGH90_00550 [Pseudomonadota bacterium]